jgi:homoserine O-acetyltransferase
MSITTDVSSSAGNGPGNGPGREQSPGSADRQPAQPGPQPGPQPTYEGDFVLDEYLLLDCGRTLAGPTLHYAVYGRLNPARNNAVLVCHALSGSAQVGAWWPEIFAPEGLLNLERDCVICINLLGSCYGSTGPASVNRETGELYGPDFPVVSIRDNVRAQGRLLDSLGIHRLRLVLGGSIGGMQALDWAIQHPDRVEHAAIIAVAPLSAMGIALNHLQRRAIQQDPDWAEGNYPSQRPPRRGLALARQIAMLSYKSPSLFDERFGRNPNRNGEDPRSLEDGGRGLVGGRFDIAGYLDYQGERFLDRFDANSYLAILRTMENWDPHYGFASPAEAYGRIRARLSFVGISSDWLFPPESVRLFANTIRSAGVDAGYREMASQHGHDAFLAEQAELVKLLQ